MNICSNLKKLLCLGVILCAPLGMQAAQKGKKKGKGSQSQQVVKFVKKEEEANKQAENPTQNQQQSQNQIEKPTEEQKQLELQVQQVVQAQESQPQSNQSATEQQQNQNPNAEKSIQQSNSFWNPNSLTGPWLFDLNGKKIDESNLEIKSQKPVDLAKVMPPFNSNTASQPKQQSTQAQTQDQIKPQDTSKVEASENTINPATAQSTTTGSEQLTQPQQPEQMLTRKNAENSVQSQGTPELSEILKRTLEFEKNLETQDKATKEDEERSLENLTKKTKEFQASLNQELEDTQRSMGNLLTTFKAQAKEVKTPENTIKTATVQPTTTGSEQLTQPQQPEQMFKRENNDAPTEQDLSNRMLMAKQLENLKNQLQEPIQPQKTSKANTSHANTINALSTAKKPNQSTTLQPSSTTQPTQQSQAQDQQLNKLIQEPKSEADLQELLEKIKELRHNDSSNTTLYDLENTVLNLSKINSCKQEVSATGEPLNCFGTPVVTLKTGIADNLIVALTDTVNLSLKIVSDQQAAELDKDTLDEFVIKLREAFNDLQSRQDISEDNKKVIRQAYVDWITSIDSAINKAMVKVDLIESWFAYLDHLFSVPVEAETAEAKKLRTEVRNFLAKKLDEKPAVINLDAPKSDFEKIKEMLGTGYETATSVLVGYPKIQNAYQATYKAQCIHTHALTAPDTTDEIKSKTKTSLAEAKKKLQLEVDNLEHWKDDLFYDVMRAPRPDMLLAGMFEKSLPSDFKLAIQKEVLPLWETIKGKKKYVGGSVLALGTTGAALKYFAPKQYSSAVNLFRRVLKYIDESIVFDGSARLLAGACNRIGFASLAKNQAVGFEYFCNTKVLTSFDNRRVYPWAKQGCEFIKNSIAALGGKSFWKKAMWTVGGSVAAWQLTKFASNKLGDKATRANIQKTIDIKKDYKEKRNNDQ